MTPESWATSKSSDGTTIRRASFSDSGHAAICDPFVQFVVVVDTGGTAAVARWRTLSWVWLAREAAVGDPHPVSPAVATTSTSTANNCAGFTARWAAPLMEPTVRGAPTEPGDP